ncbi:hypothetical protein [Pimelobacter sp. 30-1]|uniref:hypothetical protein n=1 Tax=Pimelobacter sp. 30-1 TaxID=2004991 RepID=UPI001C05CE7E|nr:hypothetical protein [Pimelobacter sp. 30-1]MBU2693850.1 hypothetical protein [Pimelobacter sp. 30-1]
MITPGLHHAMTIEDYRARTGHLSSSVLRKALPERYPAAGASRARAFGALFHAVVLDPDRLDDRYVVLDPGKVGRRKDGSVADHPTATTAWRTAAAEVATAGKTLVSPEDWERAHAMRDAVTRSPSAAALLFDLPGATGVSAFYESPAGLRHKARYDRLLDGIVVDLKSTGTRPGADALARAVVDHGYDLGAAHDLAVGDGLELALERVALVFVSKEPPHHRVTVCDLAEEFLRRGRALRALAVERLTDPAAETYEGADGPLTLALPRCDRIEQRR